MFQLNDIRNSKVWQEARVEGLHEGIVTGMEKGIEKGMEKGMEKGLAEAQLEFARTLHAKGVAIKQIAEYLNVSLPEAKRLVKQASNR